MIFFCEMYVMMAAKLLDCYGKGENKILGFFYIFVVIFLLKLRRNKSIWLYGMPWLSSAIKTGDL